MNALQLDVRYALRQMVKHPGLSAVMVLTLALGIGANTMIFSLANSVLLRPLPYEKADRFVQLRYDVASADIDSVSFSIPESVDYRQSRTFQSLSEYHTMTFTLLGWGDPQRVRTGVVSADFFDTMGIKPYLGRTFRPGEDRLGANLVLVLSYDFWRHQLRGDRAVVGKVLQMNGLSLTAIGVLPPLPQYPGQDDLYITVPACPFRSNPQNIVGRSGHLLTLFGRLRPGVSLAQAQAEVATTAKRLRQEYPQYYGGVRSANVTLVPVPELMVSEIRPTLFILLATVGLVLLITCANLANLSLARLLRREQEVILRVALGAGRGRLLRQLLTESVLLALVGGALGLALAVAGADLLVAFARLFTPRVQDITIDANVLIFTFLVSVLTGVGFGLVPAVQMTRRSPAAFLKEGGQATLGTSRQRFRSALIVVQVALAFVLLTAAGLMIRSLRALQDVKSGYDPTNVLTLRIDLPFTRYSMPTSMPFFRRLLEEIQRHPSVRSAAVASSFPLYQQPPTPLLRIEGRPTDPGEEQPEADFLIVSPDYFKTLGIRLLQGRLFSDTDTDGKQYVAVVSQSLARRYWPNQSPIGHRIMSSTFSGNIWLTVIGVVDDVRHARADTQPTDTFYVSYLQAEEIYMSVLVRTVGNPAVVVNEIRRVVHAMDPEQPLADIQTLEELRDRSIAPSRLTADLLVVFALLAFTITAIGLSAVVSFVVSQRTQELGLRMALGANRISLLGMVMRQGMFLVLLGLVLGWTGALAGNRLLSSLLFGVQPSDPFTFWSITLALIVCGAAACFIPARRATFIDPKEALRS